MRAGQYDKRVSLSRSPVESGDSDGFFEDLSPSRWWASIQPLEPTSSDGQRAIASVVSMRFHPQVTIDTRIVYGTRELFVRGVQNPNERGAELRLYCEEVQP